MCPEGSSALVISANEYKEAGWNNLPGAKSDSTRRSLTLEKQEFTVTESAEPTSEILLPRQDYC
ncbi:MAG TPA: hypothetical protein VER14_00935 [Phototrophicaceae bacterium]|nr:hypothetical protein [Phototrophicaceae bacterium]